MEDQEHTHELTSLTLFERKEYEELKRHFFYESNRLRERAVILGVLVVSFIATLMVCGVLKIDTSVLN